MALFNHTIGTLQTILKEIKRFVFYSTLVIQLIFIAYHAVSIAIPLGIILVHALLLAFSVAYLLVYLITHNMELSKEEKKKTKLTFKVSKYIINTASLVISLIWLANDVPEVTVITALPVITLAISIFVQLIGDLLSFVLSRYTKMLIEAFKADTKPITDVISFAKGSGKEKIDMVKDFYNEHKETIATTTKNIAGGVINAFSLFSKSRRIEPIRYEDKTEDDYSKNT